MIDHTNQFLAEWVRHVTDEAEISFLPPTQQQSVETPTVFIYLLDVMPDNVSRNNHRTPSLQIQLRYLITPLSVEPHLAHRILGELVFAAMEQAEFEVDLGPLPIEFWNTMGRPPTPSFMLRSHLVRDRHDTAGRVQNVIDIKSSTLDGGIEGIVVGPQGMPLVNARVRSAATGRSTRTDNRGHFYLAAAFGVEGEENIFVRVNGEEHSVTLSPGEIENQPVTINLERLEG